MTDPEQAAAEGALATEKLRRVLELFAPNATNVQIKTVHHHPGEIQIVDYRADLPNGSSVYAPYITFRGVV
ncbi:hypothetical protein [Mycolicibacterium moriokaense]|uniref:Uncharacterized protein n=1 Tax=Mycolicibacterium moriokaense TaxID=39691 RepID=A0A318HPI2_9MYCO|nr:hypothetical protein [Mycolicibacterium moriokaense]PXX11385.1 hypothetical protein C8E89_103474 [Mycolicibacterium moriokaense]